MNWAQMTREQRLWEKLKEAERHYTPLHNYPAHVRMTKRHQRNRNRYLQLLRVWADASRKSKESSEVSTETC